MYEVIIERPRGGAGWARPWPRRIAWRQLAQDDDGSEDGGPTKVCMGPRVGSKWLNENLAPLRRFLLSRVGRPWNDVHSEIAAHIAPRSAVQTHVLTHLDHYVERHVVMIDGWPHHPIAWGKDRQQVRPLASWKYSFYVDPETGLLRLAWKRRVRASELK